MNIKYLTKREKIELIRKIVAGEVKVVAGQIIESGVVLIKKDEAYFLNGVPVDKEQFSNIPGCTLIILPAKEIDK